MRNALTAAGFAILMAGLALAPRAVSAQGYSTNPFDRPDAPALALRFTPEQVRHLDREFDEDLRALNAFGGTRRLDRFSISHLERPLPWRLYGRLGIFNFQNELDPQQSQGLRLSFRRTGPSLTGRIYIGIHRTFD